MSPHDPAGAPIGEYMDKIRAFTAELAGVTATHDNNPEPDRNTNMNPHEHIKNQVAAIVRMAVRRSDMNVPDDAPDDVDSVAYNDEVENIAAEVVGRLHESDLIAYPTPPGDTLDPTDPVDVALGIARDTLREPLGDQRVTVIVLEDGTVNVETGSVVTIHDGGEA